MSKLTRILIHGLLTVLLVAGFSASTVNAALGVNNTSAEIDRKFVFGGFFTLSSGQTLNEDLYIFGGMAELETGSIVNGDIVLMGGSLDAGGTINGSISAFGGTVNVARTANVTGGLTSFGAAVYDETDPNSYTPSLPGQDHPEPPAIPAAPRFGSFEWFIKILTSLFWKVLQAFLMAGLASILMALLPRNMEQARLTLQQAPLASAGTGILASLVLPAVLLILILSLCLIPVALLLVFAVIFAWLASWALLGLQFGMWMEGLFKVDWQPAVTAGVGTLILSLGYQLFILIPCIGWASVILAAGFGFGALLLSRFGTQSYPVRY